MDLVKYYEDRVTEMNRQLVENLGNGTKAFVQDLNKARHDFIARFIVLFLDHSTPASLVEALHKMNEKYELKKFEILTRITKSDEQIMAQIAKIDVMSRFYEDRAMIDTLIAARKMAIDRKLADRSVMLKDELFQFRDRNLQSLTLF